MTTNPAKPKPRMLFLATEYYYFISHKKELAAAALAAGFEVYVAARCEGGRSEIAGINVIPFGWQRPGSTLRAFFQFLPDLYRVMRLFDGVKPDIVHNISLKPAIIGSVAAFGRKLRVVNSINGFGYIFYARSIGARLAQKACAFILRLSVRLNDARIVLQNADDAALVRGSMGVGGQHVRLIRGSGIAPDAFQPQPAPPTPPVKFLVLSRLLYMKGVQVAVAAFTILKARGANAELVICGAPDPGNPSSISVQDIEMWAKIPGVTVLGHVNDVKPVIAASHVVLQPALGGEGLPRALLEAAAMERPMIASDIPGNREIVVPGETGVLVAPNDPTALTNAMERVMGQPAELERWGKAARAKLIREFSAETVRAQHVQLYGELTNP